MVPACFQALSSSTVVTHHWCRRWRWLFGLVLIDCELEVESLSCLIDMSWFGKYSIGCILHARSGQTGSELFCLVKRPLIKQTKRSAAIDVLKMVHFFFAHIQTSLPHFYTCSQHYALFLLNIYCGSSNGILISSSLWCVWSCINMTFK